MVSENVRKLRVAKGVTQSRLAKSIKVTNITYSRIENGKSKLGADELFIISKVLTVPIETFFDSKLTDSMVSEIGGL